MIRALLAVLLALPAAAQTRVSVRPVLFPALGVAPLAAPSFAPPALTGLTLSAPSLVSVIPTLTPVVAKPATPQQKLLALQQGVSLAAASLQKKDAPPGALHAAGADIEALLAGTHLSAPSQDVPDAPPSADAEFALAASPSLASRADDLGSAKGLKAATMNGAQFVGLLEQASASPRPAPNPAAGAAAREVETALVRVMRALIAAEKPVKESLPRALAVWQVFDQEMAIAAKSGLDAIIADARPFASQVEASVEKPLEKPAPKPEEPKANPADPNGYDKIAKPGSVFGWKPIEESPNHGFPLLDRLIRKLLAQKRSPYVKGFERSGGTGGSGVFFYGERHTDPGLITENMRRLVADAKPGKPMIVLVESYTGWSLRGWEALDYLTKRGLDADALAKKGVHSGELEVRGWDTAINHDESGREVRRRHMDLLAMNLLAHGELRGWAYYSAMAKAAWTALSRWPALWRSVVTVRNKDLDAAVASAVKESVETSATVHVIAGTDHLVEYPRLSGIPLIGRPVFRRSLRRAVGGRAWRAAQPANTIP